MCYHIHRQKISDFLGKITGESAMNQLSPPEFSRLKPEAADDLKESSEKNISPQEFSRLIQEEQKWLNEHLDELIHEYAGKRQLNKVTLWVLAMIIVRYASHFFNRVGELCH